MSQGSEFVDQWFEVMLDMNLTPVSILELTPTKLPPASKKNGSIDSRRYPDTTRG